MNKIKEFFSDGLDVIIKMCVTQMGMTMFGLMLAIATKDNNTFLLITSCFSVLLYMYILYIHVWEKGAKDRIRADGGRIKPNKLLGLYYSLVANALNIILAVLANIGYLFLNTETMSPTWAANMYGVCNAIARFIHAMYLGIINVLFKGQVYGLLVALIPAIALSAGAYVLGFNNVNILGNKNYYKPKKNK